MNPASLWDGVAMWLVNHSVTAEATLKKLEEAWERLEDVSGRA
jgi:hypothetical protein